MRQADGQEIRHRQRDTDFTETSRVAHKWGNRKKKKAKVHKKTFMIYWKCTYENIHIRFNAKK